MTSAQELIDRHFFSISYNRDLVWILAKRTVDRRSRMDAYIRSIQAIDVACNRILAPWKATKECVLIAFGQARFNGTKGCPSAPTKCLHHRLQKVHTKEGRCILVDIGEFRTTQICSTCGTQMSEVLDEESCVIYSLKACPTCFTVQNRDANAAHGIGVICRSMLVNDIRPEVYCRGQAALEKLTPVRRNGYCRGRRGLIAH